MYQSELMYELLHPLMYQSELMYELLGPAAGRVLLVWWLGLALFDVVWIFVDDWMHGIR